MEAREENCSFAAELLFVISRPSPSNITASPSPSHLLRGGAYMHAGAASFLPPPPFPGLNSGWPCVCQMSVTYTDTDVIYSVIARRLSWSWTFFTPQLRGVCTVQMLSCIWVQGVCDLGSVSLLRYQKLCGWCAATRLPRLPLHPAAQQEPETQCYRIWGCWVWVVCCWAKSRTLNVLSFLSSS